MPVTLWSYCRTLTSTVDGATQVHQPLELDGPSVVGQPPPLIPLLASLVAQDPKPRIVVRARGRGQSFHDQGLITSPNAHPQGRPTHYILLDQMRVQMSFHPVQDGHPWSAAIVASGWATFGDLFDLAVQNGFLPYVVPTSRRISLGGGVGADVLCQRSPLVGKFDEAVEWVRVLRADGQVVCLFHPDEFRLANGAPAKPVASDVVLPEAENAQGFGALFGGSGLLGIVLELRVGLLDVRGCKRVDARPKAKLRAITRITTYSMSKGAPGLGWIGGFLSEYAEIARQHPVHAAKAATPGQRALMRAWTASTWSTIGMFTVNAPDAKLVGGLCHLSMGFQEHRSLEAPYKPWDRPTAVATIEAALNLNFLPGNPRGVDNLFHGELVRGAGAAAGQELRLVDELASYNFFLESHTMATERLRTSLRHRVGRMTQATFSFPLVAGADGTWDVTNINGFMQAARDHFHDANHAMVPNVSDILVLPQSDGVLAPPHGHPMMAVTFAFEGLDKYPDDAGAPTVSVKVRDGSDVNLAYDWKDRMMGLADLAQDWGGVIHFSKSVWVRPETLNAMYGTRLATFLAIKADWDPHGVWSSDHHTALVAASAASPRNPASRQPPQAPVGTPYDTFGPTPNDVLSNGGTAAMWLTTPAPPVPTVFPPVGSLGWKPLVPFTPVTPPTSVSGFRPVNLTADDLKALGLLPQPELDGCHDWYGSGLQVNTTFPELP